MSRNRLHVTKLDDFAQFCESRGWTKVATKGEYEVLRMTRGMRGDPPLIVHTKLATSAGNDPVHLTLHGVAEKMFSVYRRAALALSQEKRGDE